jgi:hypothetical protein
LPAIPEQHSKHLSKSNLQQPVLLCEAPIPVHFFFKNVNFLFQRFSLKLLIKLHEILRAFPHVRRSHSHDYAFPVALRYKSIDVKIRVEADAHSKSAA